MSNAITDYFNFPKRFILMSQHFNVVFNVTNVTYKFLNVIKMSLVMSQKIVFNVAKMGFNVKINGFLRLHKNRFSMSQKNVLLMSKKSTLLMLQKKAFSCPKN